MNSSPPWHLVVYELRAPYERSEVDGTVIADVLTAAMEASGSGYYVCGGSNVDVVREEHHVSGRFSGDGRALTAEDVMSLHLTSGETVTYRYDWSATRQ
jgi:hypothetical protein